MKAIRRPKPGCFRATFPSTAWEEVPCYVAPNHPAVPRRRGGVSRTVGDTQGDAIATSAAADIVEAIGYFTKAENVSSVSSQGGDGTCYDTDNRNAFTVQLNTNEFETSWCNGHGPNCRGWQQFIVESDGDIGWWQSFLGAWSDRTPYGIYMQYWLIGYGSGCPIGWIQSGDSCFANSNETRIRELDVDDLTHLELIGGSYSASSGSPVEVILTSTDGRAICGDPSGTAEGQMCAISAPPPRNIHDEFDLLGSWHDAEFNVFGDACGARAMFNQGATLEAGLSFLTSNSPPHISCADASYTGETNNLDIGTGSDGCCSTGNGIRFEESNGQGEPVCCPVCAPGTCGGDGCGGSCACGLDQACGRNHVCEAASTTCPAGEHMGESCTTPPHVLKPICVRICVKD